MHTRHTRRIDMFRRVREVATVPSVSADIVAPVAELDGIVVRLADLTAREATHRQRKLALTRDIRELSTTIRRECLRPAVIAARRFPPGTLVEQGGLREVMRLPLGENRQRLVAAGLAAANLVEEHPERFMGAGLPKDFAARIRVRVEALTAAIDARATEEQRAMAARKGIEVETRRGFSTVLLLDALLTPVFRADPAREVEWRKAMKIARRPKPAEAEEVTDEA